MNKSNLYRVGVGLFLAMLVFAGSWVVPASAAPGDDQPFTYTITARGTSMQQYYPPQSFSWTVTTTGTETWAEYGVLLGEWTIEQWGFGENVIKSWLAPANAVIKRWSYTQQDLGWQVAQGWDTGTHIEGSGLNNQLDISFFTGGTILWRGGYRATYRIYGDLYHYDPASKMQSGNGTVYGSQGDRPIANVSLAAPPGLHGGTVAVSSRTVTDTNSRVTTTLDEASGTVYAITSYSETFSGPWTSSQMAGATVNTADGNKYITTSNRVAPNGDTTWSVVDNRQNVDTWMEGNKLYARVLSIADKPFNYTIQASGTKTTTTYPNQGFNWTVTTTGTETWVESDILLGELTVLEWGYAELRYFGLDAPANSQITRWDYDQHDLGWQYAQGWDGGSYLDGNHLVIKAYTGGTWLWTGGYWATYRIYGNQYHYDTVSMTQSGSGVVNGAEGDKFIANFSLAAPPAQHGGTVVVNSRTITDTNGQVTTRIDQAAGKVYASTSYSVTTTDPWSNIETGASAINCAEGDKYIATSTLAAPDGNTTWSVTDNNANVDTWMVGNKLYARALNLAPTARDDSNLAAVEDTPLVVAAPGVLGNDFDPEGDSITALIVSVPSHGSLTLNADGSFMYAPNPNYNGPDSFTYVAKDFSRQSAPATVSIGVTSVNDLPTISNIADRTIGEDGTTGAIPFTIGDIETAAGSLTLSATSSNPTLVPNENIVFGGSGANRTLTVTPAPNGNGTATITVGATDADGGKAEDSFVLTVTAVNDAPTITDIASQTTNEDTPTAAINFIVGDAETPAGNLTLQASTSNPALVPNGNIVFGGAGGNRNVTITPAPNQSGTANITVTVSDGTATASDSFLLTVNAVNDLPTVSNIPNQTINEGEAAATISFTVSDQETPAGNLIVSAQSSDTTLVPNENIVLGGSGDSRTLKITPASDQNGTCVIAVWVEDSDGGKVYVNFVLTVNAVNDVPSFTKGAYQTVLEDAGMKTVTAWATNINSGPADESDQTLSFIVNNDNNSLFAEQPAIAPNGTLTYRSAANAYGSAVVSIRLRDSGGTDRGGVDTSASQSFTIVVTSVNDAPVIASPIADVTADEDDPDRNINLADVFADADIATNGDSLVLTLVANGNPSLLGATISGSSLTLHYNADQNGSATITIRAADTGGLWVEDSFQVAVNPVNDPPVASNDTKTTAEDTLLSFAASSLATNDRTGPGNESSQTLTVTAVSAVSAQGGTAILAGGNINYMPAANFRGTDTFAYIVTDNGTTRGAADPRSASATVTVTIGPVNDPPVIMEVPPATINEGSSTTVDLDSIVSDMETPEGQITWSVVSGNTGVATVSVNSTTRVVTITGVDNGTAQVTLTATDRGDPNGGSGNLPSYSAPLSTSAVVAVTVRNLAPTIISVVNNGPSNEGASATVTATATDPAGDNDPLGYEFDCNNDGIYDVGPQPGNSTSHVFGDNGSFKVNVRVSDGDGGVTISSTTVVSTLVVRNVTPTILLSGDNSINEGSLYTLILGNVIDPGQDTVSGYSINWGDDITDAFAGSPNTVSKTHTYADGPNNYVISISLSDEDGTFDGGTESITVDNVAPSNLALSTSPATTDETENTTLDGSFTDPGTLDTHAVVIKWGDGSADTTLNLEANVLGFTATHQYLDNKPGDAAYAIDVSVTDKDGASTSASTTVVVKNVAPMVNAAPDSTINQSDTFSGSGSFTDPGSDTWAATVNYGDGSGVNPLTLSGKNFSLSHVYANSGSYWVTVTVTDDDGGAGSDQIRVTVIDNVAPTTTASQDPAANANGWNNGNVTVSFSAADNPGGAGVKEIHYKVNSAPEIVVSGSSATVSLADEGVYTVAYFARDNSGNSETAKSLTVRIDKTAPVITAGRTPPNAAGWNNGNVTVDFTASDSLSSLASVTPNVVVSAEGAGQSVTGTAVDLAGNRASVTLNNINIDKTAPVITATRTPANANGWNNGDVAVAFAASDSLSGVASVTPDAVVTAEGAGQSVTGTVTDLADNSASVTVSNINIDKTAPVITATRTPANANGWNNGNVAVDFTASDILSGVASVTPNVVVSSEGAGQTVTGTVTDLAGNSASVTVSNINVDKTLPVITATRTPANANGWNNGNVAIDFAASDSLSGVASVSPNVVVTAEGAGQSVTGAVTDLAGNNASVTVSNINIDKTLPVITATRTPANANGWNNGDVTVDFTGSDSLSGVASLTPATVVSAEGASHSVTGTAVDLAGNSASVTVGDINIDKTKPTLTFGAVTPAPNAAGWNNTDVQIAYTPGDALSGVASTSTPSPLSFTAEGSNLTQTVVVTDTAGNSQSFTTTVVKIDKTAPVITATRTPANAAGWNNGDVAVDYTASDSLSGVATVTPDTVVSAEGASQSVTGTVVDLAGNSASVTVGDINIDKTVPVVTIVSPQAGDYLTSASVTLDFGSVDALSGIAGMVATLDGITVANGQVVNLAGVAGSHTLTVVATDVAGNSQAESTTFVVVIDSTVDVNPDTLNLKSKSDKNAVTVNVEFPSGYDVSRIDLSTVVLNVNGTLVMAQLSPSSMSDSDGDGVPDAMVKFDRATVIAALGATTGDIRVIVSGQLTDGRRFLGSDTIKVINPAK